MYDKETVAALEGAYARGVKTAARGASLAGKHLILVTGASCAGKTTTSMRIKDEIEQSGDSAFIISLDDFYLNPADEPREEGAAPDYESPECLDLALIAESFTRISEGKTTKLPIFDFGKRQRLDEYRFIRPDEHTYLIVEGLHALNPGVIGEHSHQNAHRVYLRCETPLYDAKLLRRLVRDVNYRNAPASLTFFLWDSVKRGEQKYIAPFFPSADTVIDTYFEYELSAFREEGLALIAALDKESPYRPLADHLAGLLEEAAPFDKNLIPPSSIMWEFLRRE